jgi:transcriptional regulator with XRE-family HTH domain
MTTAGQYFKEVRKTAGMTQDEVACKLKVTKQYISAIEHGKRKFPREKIASPHDIFGNHFKEDVFLDKLRQQIRELITRINGVYPLKETNVIHLLKSVVESGCKKISLDDLECLIAAEKELSSRSSGFAFSPQLVKGLLEQIESSSKEPKSHTE